MADLLEILHISVQFGVKMILKIQRSLAQKLLASHILTDEMTLCTSLRVGSSLRADLQY